MRKAEYLPFDPQGASINDYYFAGHATYFVMRQTSWGDVEFQNSTLAADGNNKLWLIKMDASGNLETSKLIASTGNQYVFGDLIYGANDTLYVLGESNQDFNLDQGSFETDQYKSNMFVFLADTNFNTVLCTIDDTTGGQSTINNPKMIKGSIYACGWFVDTVKVNGETFEGSSYTAWWGKLAITDAEDTTTSISALEKVDLKIYPNPASDQLNIESGSGDISAIEFYDLTGKLVKPEYVNHTHFTTINISELTNGVYLINTVGDASAKLQKLIVRK